MGSIVVVACVHLESMDGGGRLRNRRWARPGTILITSSGRAGAWSGRRWIRGPSASGEARPASGNHVVVAAGGWRW